MQPPKDGFGTYVVKVPVAIPVLKRSRNGQSSSPARQFEPIEHIMIALSLFLEIDSYGETLVEYDKNAAKRLIYLLVGLEPPSNFISKND